MWVGSRFAASIPTGTEAAQERLEFVEIAMGWHGSFNPDELSCPQLLVIDEVGYLSYSNRYADLMFELISRRYQNKSTLITTNRPFAKWREVFPNAACVVSLVDRLVHNAEIVAIDGKSYRLKEAHDRTEKRARRRRGPKSSASRQTRRCPRIYTRSTLAFPALGPPKRRLSCSS